LHLVAKLPQGCVFAALACEVARQPDSVRDVLTREFKNALEFLAQIKPADDPSNSYDDAIATFVSMTGALILARAVNDRTLSNRILKTTAERLIKRTGRPQIRSRRPRSARPKTAG
jgi:TetR/AcrR family transcriptional regulator, transcriptional repressor for nem operon